MTFSMEHGNNLFQATNQMFHIFGVRKEKVISNLVLKIKINLFKACLSHFML